MGKENLDSIDRKLAILLKLTALSLSPDGTKSELISLLASVDLAPKEIADIVGTSPASVRATLSRLRKEGKL
jgi:DNA-binding CsgD family transcriptional regulator